jgi:hypothetical protein
MMRESHEREFTAFRATIPARVEDDGFWHCAIYSDGAARVSWKDHFDFVVSGDGCDVFWRRLVDVSDEVLFTYLLGQVLSFSLVALGSEPLHATSVVVDGSAVAFLGDCGAGKSTLAAALLERGHRLLTDDLLVTEVHGNRIMAYPSLPRIKLTPASADVVFDGRRAIPMNRFTHKMIFPLEAEQVVAAPVPLRHVYVLSEPAGNPDVTIHSIERRDAFLAVIRNTFNDSILRSDRLKRQFVFVRDFLQAVDVKALDYPRALERLPEVVDAVLRDVTGSRAE